MICVVVSETGLYEKVASSGHIKHVEDCDLVWSIHANRYAVEKITNLNPHSPR